MHDVHLHWRTRNCGGFYIYARAFAIQGSCRALVVGSDILGPDRFRPGPPRNTKTTFRWFFHFLIMI